MKTVEFIPINKLCTWYEVEVSFFNDLSELGLIEIQTIEHSQYVHQDKINDIEKMIRMHHELDINVAGIEIVFNLLQKIEDLQNELIALRNRLNLYESR
jgi:hypothetical protein